MFRIPHGGDRSRAQNRSDMEVIKYPEKETWEGILKRPAIDSLSLVKKVKKILDTVKRKGDKAVKKYSKEFDRVTVKKPGVSEKEMKEAEKLIAPGLKDAIALAKRNIEKFHLAQLQTNGVIETMPGVTCWCRNVAIEKVGLYIPGGTAPLFSTLLMLGIPAKLAGCKEIVLCCFWIVMKNNNKAIILHAPEKTPMKFITVCDIIFCC